MAFTVEDGSGVVGANSYTTVAFADAYFEERGNAVWAAIADDADKEKLLIQATDYIELIYCRRFIGDMVATDQALSWPRNYADPYPNDAIPLALQKACAEYALRANDGPLLPDPTVDANGFASVVKRKKIGPIEKEFEVMNGGKVYVVRSYPVPDGYMYKLLAPGTYGNRVIR
jgi:hypothetical protein